MTFAPSPLSKAIALEIRLCKSDAREGWKVTDVVYHTRNAGGVYCYRFNPWADNVPGMSRYVFVPAKIECADHEQWRHIRREDSIQAARDFLGSLQLQTEQSTFFR